ncbi:hypothetical protein, partial [Thiolapillus sp.]|uniref:hypothetical protein n=1 Tax=Thiolapillus sp. TaxID=2017437 RepID=UPI003AF5BC4C
RPAERQRGQQSGRKASRAAERPAERQKGQQSGREASKAAERPADSQKPTAGQNDQTNTNKKQIFDLQKRKRKVYLKNENQKTNSNHEKHTRASAA